MRGEKLWHSEFLWSEELPSSQVQSSHCPQSKRLSLWPAASHSLHLENGPVIGDRWGRLTRLNGAGGDRDASNQKPPSIDEEGA